MAVEVERLIVALEAKIDGYNRDLAQAQATTQAKLSAVETKFVETERVIAASMGRAAATTVASMNSMTAAMSVAGRAALAQNVANQNLIAGMSAFGGAAGIAATNVALLPPPLKTTEQALKKVSSSATHAGHSFGSMAVMLGAIGVYITASTLRAYADSWNSVSRALDAGEQIFGVRLRSMESLNQLANQARIDNDAFTKLYVRTAAATRELGVAEEDVAKATSTVAKALKLGTASASEQTSTMLQLSQALQKGKLDGDEFRTVMENAGVIQELLADRLKVSKGEIVKMAAEGKLKVQDLFGALVDGAEQVDRIFNQMPATIEESFLVLNNQIEQYIGHLDKTYNITQSVANAQAFLAKNIETVGDAALVAGIGLLAMFAPAILAGVVGVGAAAAATAGSVGLLTGAVGASAAAFSLFGEDVKLSEDGLVSFKDVVQALTEELAASVDVADEAGQSYLETIAKLASMGKGIAGALPVIGPMVHAVEALTTAWQAASEAEGSFADRVRRNARERALGRGFVTTTETNRAIPDKPVIKTDEVDKAAERARKAFEKDLLRAEQRIDMAKIEGEAIGRSAEQVEYMRTRQELLNEARKAGIELTDADYLKIEALAQSTARAVTQAENLQRAYQEASEESKQMLSQFIKDMKDGVSASEALGNALNRIADKLIDMAVNDLVEVALGGLTGRGGNPTQGGLGAGLLSLFGFKDGGVAAHGRPQALQRFANGGISKSAAIFGEAGPEAAVPLSGGRYIPVELRAPKIPTANATTGSAVNVTVAPVFNIESATPETVGQLKESVIPQIRDLVKSEVVNVFERKARFARSGI